MLQVPPTGAPAARVPSRAPQSDPADPAFAGVMAQAALPVPTVTAPAQAPSDASATGRAAAAAKDQKSAAKSESTPSGEATQESESPERPETAEQKPAAAEENAQAAPAQVASNATPAPKAAPNPQPIPQAEPLAIAPPQLNSAAAPAAAQVAPVAMEPVAKAAPPLVPTPPDPTQAIPVSANPEPVPPKAALAAPATVPDLPKPAVTPAEQAAPSPMPQPLASPAEPMKAPILAAADPGKAAQVKTAADTVTPAESALQTRPAMASQATRPGVQAQTIKSDPAADVSRVLLGSGSAEENPRIQAPGAGQASQQDFQDLAQGLKGQVTLIAESANSARTEAPAAFAVPKAMLVPPVASGPAKSHPAAAESPSKEAPPAPAQEPASARNPAAIAAQGKDATVALPRSESLGLQPAQGGSAAIQGLPKENAAIATKGSVQLQWQTPAPSLVNQVEGGIRWMLRSSTQGAELQLHPENLGRVRIELKVEGGEVHARLWASDPKSIPVLQDNKAFLEVSLKEQGLNLGSFDLRQNPQQAQTQQQNERSGQFWTTEAPKHSFRQETPIATGLLSAQARRLELFA